VVFCALSKGYDTKYGTTPALLYVAFNCGKEGRVGLPGYHGYQCLVVVCTGKKGKDLMDTDPNRAVTYRELLKMTEDELISRHDALAAPTGYVHVGVDYYLEALRSKAMLRYTWWITAMTFIMAVATIINLVIACLVLRKA
jgi:hypothetical protein